MRCECEPRDGRCFENIHTYALRIPGDLLACLVLRLRDGEIVWVITCATPDDFLGLLFSLSGYYVCGLFFLVLGGVDGVITCPLMATHAFAFFYD